MNDQEYLIDAFGKSFIGKECISTAIYGVSGNTQVILEAFPEFEVLGIMDGFLKEGEIYGKEILSEDKALSLGVKRIIIVARAATVKIVFNRIRAWCTKNSISVFDVNGDDLFVKFEKGSDFSSKYKEDLSALKAKIDKYDTISFDVFDTILMREILYPTDLFLILEKQVKTEYGIRDFCCKRVEAERKLLSGKYPAIGDIYDVLAEEIGKEKAQKIKEAEIKLEKSVLIMRESMREAYDYAIGLGKCVYFVSDMYMPESFFKETFEEKGITGYRGIIVSSTYGIMKSEGLFKVLIRENIGKKILHIGDNYEFDIKSAEKCGIDAYKVFSALEMMENSSYQGLLNYADTLERRNAIGLIVSRIFNSPFKLYNTKGIPVADDLEMAYALISPIIVTYMDKLIGKASSGEYDDILFLARDGYLLKKLYDLSGDKKIDGMPTGTYFLTSRFPCLVCGIHKDEDICGLVDMGYDGSPEELLKYRFLLKDEQIKTHCEGQELKGYVLSHRNLIFEAAESLRKNYLKYASKMGIKKGGRYLFTDLAASGTCQLLLEQILDISGEGQYFVFIEDEKKKGRVKVSSLFDIDNWFHKKAFICESYVLLENIVTSKKPSLLSVDVNGEPIYGAELRNYAQVKRLEELQEQIISYYKKYLRLTKDTWIDAEAADYILSLMRPEKTDLTETEVYGEALIDEFFGRQYSFRDILA